MTTREALLLSRGSVVHEEYADSDRLVAITARNAGDENAGTVFLDVWNADQGLVSVALPRAEFYQAIKAELGLVDPLEELFAL